MIVIKPHGCKVALFSPAVREPKDAQNGGKIPGPHGLSQHCVDAGGGDMARRPGDVQPDRQPSCNGRGDGFRQPFGFQRGFAQPRERQAEVPIRVRRRGVVLQSDQDPGQIRPQRVRDPIQPAKAAMVVPAGARPLRVDRAGAVGSEVAAAVTLRLAELRVVNRQPDAAAVAGAAATAANRPARAPARSPSIHSEAANEVRSIGSTACSIISLHTVGETVSWNPGSMQSVRWRNIALRRLLHQRQSVTVGIAEKCHPQIVIVHGSNQMRRSIEDHALLL